MEKIWRFLKDEEGTEVVEWGIVAALLIAASVAVFGQIGGWVSTKINALYTALIAVP